MLIDPRTWDEAWDTISRSVYSVQSVEVNREQNCRMRTQVVDHTYILWSGISIRLSSVICGGLQMMKLQHLCLQS